MARTGLQGRGLLWLTIRAGGGNITDEVTLGVESSRQVLGNRRVYKLYINELIGWVSVLYFCSHGMTGPTDILSIRCGPRHSNMRSQWEPISSIIFSQGLNFDAPVAEMGSHSRCCHLHPKSLSTCRPAL